MFLYYKHYFPQCQVFYQKSWIRIIKTAKLKQIIVLKENIDSPKRCHVSIGKIIKPVEDPMNLAVHAEPVVSTIALYAYQKQIDVGTPKISAEVNDFPFHHSEINCAFKENQPKI